MRIAIVTPVFPPYGGGMGAVAFQHARILQRHGYSVTVFTPEYGRSHEQRHAFGVVHLWPLLRAGNAAYVPKLEKKLAGFDLVHFHYPFIGAAAAVARWRERGTGKLLLHYHMDLIAPGWKGVLFSRYQRRAVTRLLDVADRVAVLSVDYAQNGFLQSALTEYPTDRFVELPNGVDAGHFTPGEKPRALIDRYRLAGKRVVLFVGGLDAAHYFKGVDVLLSAIAKMPADAQLLIVGSGARRRDFEHLAHRLGISQRVTFLGAVSNAELPDHYRLSDVVTLPSVTRSEAFGLVLLEGMACGRPVVGSNLPGVRTVVSAGVTGELAEPGNVDDLAAKLSTILSNPDLASAMGRAGRKLVEQRYGWSVVENRLLALYQTLLPRRSCARSWWRLLVNMVAVGLWIGVIFWFSAQPDLKSGLETWQDLILRKIAHLAEYFVLTYLYLRCWSQDVRQRWFTMVSAFVFALLVAGLDETHQLLVAGRSGSPVDVGIDGVGSMLLLGLLLAQGKWNSGWPKPTLRNI